MRKGRSFSYYFSIFLVVISVMLSGCSEAVPENADRIMSPSVLEVSFAGTWSLESIDSDDLELAEANTAMEGETVGFTRDTLLFEGEIYSDIRYKVKRVNVYEYFLHKKAGLPEKLDYDDSEITVTSVYSKDNFLFEFLEDKNDKKIAVIDDKYYFMKKIAEEFNADMKTMANENGQDELEDSKYKNQLLRSGLMLGVRIPVKTVDGLEDYKYGTYWISCTNRSVNQILYADDIYLPRMDGFWKLMVEKKPGLYGSEDTLNAYKVSNRKGMLLPGLFENVSSRFETRVRKAIVYVGNDYVCVENTVYGGQNANVATDIADGTANNVLGATAAGNPNNAAGSIGASIASTASTASVESTNTSASVASANTSASVESANTSASVASAATAASANTSATTTSANTSATTADVSAVEEKTLRTLPVDNLWNIDGIKISDMAGENGTMAMENAISDVFKDSGYEGIVTFDDESQEKNFALYRKTGHWFFKGRIDPDGQGQLPFMDFNLNLLPPSNMVAYDVLHVPWTKMKDKLPNAIDIYTSPNKDIAVILTRNEILLYTIENKSLSEQPLAKLAIEEGSTVIMAEWGMGEYVTSWEKSFIKNNVTKVSDTITGPEDIKTESQANQ